MPRARLSGLHGSSWLTNNEQIDLHFQSAWLGMQNTAGVQLSGLAEQRDEE